MPKMTFDVVTPPIHDRPLWNDTGVVDRLVGNVGGRNANSPADPRTTEWPVVVKQTSSRTWVVNRGSTHPAPPNSREHPAVLATGGELERSSLHPPRLSFVTGLLSGRG